VVIGQVADGQLTKELWPLMTELSLIRVNIGQR
jgi:hypothetical protein